MSFLDQLSAKVNQGFNQVTSQTKDFTEQVKIENEIKNLEKAAQANYEELRTEPDRIRRCSFSQTRLFCRTNISRFRCGGILAMKYCSPYRSLVLSF